MCIWGASWSSAKVLSGYGSASSITFIRFIIIPIVLFPFIRLAGIPIRIEKSGWKYLLLAGTLMATYTTLFFSGLKRGMPGAGGVLVTVSIPIIASFIGLVLNKRVPAKQEQIGLILGLIAGGILLSIWNKYDTLLDSGNLYFLCAAVVYASINKVTSISSRFGHPVSFNAWLHSLALVGLAVITDFSEVTAIFQNADSKFWSNMIYFGVVNSSFATTTYFFMTTKLGAEKASTFLFLVPSTAVLFSWLLLGETIYVNTIIGGLLGLVAVFIINGKIKFR